MLTSILIVLAIIVVVLLIVIAKAIGLVINCEKMVGGQFEKGLADIKLIAEAAGKK